jgi:ribosomal protein S18 acetylase RimI-like enzyme
MHYRLYAPADFPALYAIEEICFRLPFRFDAEYMAALVENPNGVTWIAEQDGQMIGFAIAGWSEDGTETEAYIQTIEVLPALRCLGVGGELLCHLEASAGAAGAEFIWLHVDAANAGAIRLYEARGYECKGREENYYARRRPALVYCKQL